MSHTHPYTFVGELTGATFSFFNRLEEVYEGESIPYVGTNEATGAKVFIQDLDTFGGDAVLRQRAEAAIARARAAAESRSVRQSSAASSSSSSSTSHIRRSRADEALGLEAWESMRTAWEWGDTSLRKTIDDGSYDADALADSVEQSIGAAIRCLHDAGLVHSDVRPSNVYLVGGAWKLGDLDRCVGKGATTIGLPPEPGYVPNGFTVGDAADARLDLHALNAVLAEIRSASG